jgi:hypothetical protein
VPLGLRLNPELAHPRQVVFDYGDSGPELSVLDAEDVDPVHILEALAARWDAAPVALVCPSI